VTPKDIHRTWTPVDSPWSPWVKPVLFAAIGQDATNVDHSDGHPLPLLPEWLATEMLGPMAERGRARSNPYRERQPLDDTAIVVDLPSATGAEFGVALTQYGFRPIPLYNALPSHGAIVDVRPIMNVLARGAEHVANVPSSAPPAFLLDAERMGNGRPVRPGLFDNRSICRSSDFPSADRLRQAGIGRILLICDEVQEDLESVALEWQAAGFELWWKRPTERQEAAPVTLRSPSWGRRIYNVLFRPSPRPRADGIYGTLIEVPSSG